ncbi:MAG: flagellar basal-body MS-ring/collar protein FliF [Bryobacteraceae bacterium]
MDQLRALLARLNLKQQVSLGVAVVVVIVGLMALARWNRERDFRPLYTGLAAEDAGAVVAKLREANVEYRVSDTAGAVLVPSSRVAELRLQMAAAGLPKAGRIGFELFDQTNFGTTNFAEQVNFRRAIEGELERSVVALTEVESARVHVTFPKESVFLESRQPAKASVLVKLRPGARLDPRNILAISHLVASAVEGLQPESVSVLDMRGNLLSRPVRAGGPDGLEAPDTMLELRQRMERDLVAKIAATLEPLLGPDRFRAGVSLECDFTSGEQSEELYDPDKTVMVNAQRSEESTAGVASSGGIPGTATNLPLPVVRPGTTSAGLSRRTENISYQSSRFVKRLRLPQGTIRRMSISLLVDHMVRHEGSGAGIRRVVEAPPPEKLKIIRDVVAAATGLQAERGDQLVVETLPFESTLHTGPEEAAPEATPAGTPIVLPEWLERALKETPLPVLIGVAVGTLLAVLGLVVFLVIRGRKKGKAKAKMAPALPQSRAEKAPGLPPGQPADFGKQLEDAIAETAALQEQREQEILNTLRSSVPTTKKSEVLRKHIGEETKKDPVAMVNIVRTWLNEPDV